MRHTIQQSTHHDDAGTVVNVEVHAYADTKRPQMATATRHSYMKSGRVVTSPHLPGPITLQPSPASTSFP